MNTKTNNRQATVKRQLIAYNYKDNDKYRDIWYLPKPNDKYRDIWYLRDISPKKFDTTIHKVTKSLIPTQNFLPTKVTNFLY